MLAIALSALALLAAGPATAGGARASAAACSSSSEVAWLASGVGNGAAGSVYYKVSVTNLGASACTARGYPTVRAVGLGGASIGAAAKQERTRVAEKLKSVTLSPGDSAQFQLRVVEAGNFSADECRAKQAAGVKVTTPGAGGARTVPFPLEVCSLTSQPTLSVGPLTVSVS